MVLDGRTTNVTNAQRTGKERPIFCRFSDTAIDRTRYDAVPMNAGRKRAMIGLKRQFRKLTFFGLDDYKTGARIPPCFIRNVRFQCVVPIGLCYRDGDRRRVKRGRPLFMVPVVGRSSIRRLTEPYIRDLIYVILYTWVGRIVGLCGRRLVWP